MISWLLFFYISTARAELTPEQLCGAKRLWNDFYAPACRVGPFGTVSYDELCAKDKVRCQCMLRGMGITETPYEAQVSILVADASFSPTCIEERRAGWRPSPILLIKLKAMLSDLFP